ncbi:MAG: hypothetical protein PUG48_02045 [Clostridia bacterium]|nr:hypothetical protein [Clostridia bacterium]
MYKVIDIIEADFGCEGLPDGEEYCVDVVLQNIDTAETVTVNVPDAELYKKEINTDSVVKFENNVLTKV